MVCLLWSLQEVIYLTTASGTVMAVLSMASNKGLSPWNILDVVKGMEASKMKRSQDPASKATSSIVLGELEYRHFPWAERVELAAEHATLVNIHPRVDTISALIASRKMKEELLDSSISRPTNIALSYAYVA